MIPRQPKSSIRRFSYPPYCDGRAANERRVAHQRDSQQRALEENPEASLGAIDHWRRMKVLDVRRADEEAVARMVTSSEKQHFCTGHWYGEWTLQCVASYPFWNCETHRRTRPTIASRATRVHSQIVITTTCLVLSTSTHYEKVQA